MPREAFGWQEAREVSNVLAIVDSTQAADIISPLLCDATYVYSLFNCSPLFLLSDTSLATLPSTAHLRWPSQRRHATGVWPHRYPPKTRLDLLMTYMWSHFSNSRLVTDAVLTDHDMSFMKSEIGVGNRFPLYIRHVNTLAVVVLILNTLVP